MRMWNVAPRLLPATIGMLAVVLAAKSASLVGSMIGQGGSAELIASALAGPHDTPAKGAGRGTKPPPKPAGHGDHGKPAASEPPPAAAIPPVPTGPPPVSESEKAVLLDLRERRLELEARETTLASREAMLTAAEGKLSARVEELQALQKRLEALDAGQKRHDDNAWQSLVKVYEAMKPRDAAAIFNDLAMPVLLSVVDRMKEAKAAAILAAMSPEKAREVTTQLASARTRATAATTEIGGKPPPPGKIPGSGT
ncbi:MAG: hypothetical protein EXR07_12270 [Acetobacteraceae bacterium]|nr:hypothetical protein [Acetobacteraceae bacterium]